MKGVKKENEKKKLERDDFVREMFVRDAEARAQAGFKTKEGFYLEPLSGPKAQKAFKKKYKVPMNSQRLFGLRGEVYRQFGLDEKGRPTTATALPGVPELTPAEGQPLASANRDPNDPTFHVAIVPIEDVEQGTFLKKTIEALGERGLVDKELRVDGIHSHYATVSRFPAGGATTPKKDIAA
jgi:hypothetical protein